MKAPWKILRVFLSSPMHTGEWRALREALLELYEADPRCEPFLLYGIERNPQAEPVREVYLQDLQRAHFLVLLCGVDLREAVAEEVDAALEAGIPILAFQDERVTPSPELDAWMERVLYPVTNVGAFNSLGSLHNQVRRALVAHMVGAVVTRSSEGPTALAEQTTIEGVSAEELAGLKANLAVARLINQGRPDEARVLYEEALELAPSNVNALFRLAFILDNFPPLDPARAVPVPKQALVLRPGDPDILFNLALATEHSGDPESAQQ